MLWNKSKRVKCIIFSRLTKQLNRRRNLGEREGHIPVPYTHLTLPPN